MASSEAETLLHEACKTGIVKDVIWALDNGADPSGRGRFAKTALHIAAINGQEDVIGILCRRKADLSLVDMGCMTALYHASREGQSGAIKVLLAHHANVHERDKAGNSLLHLTVREGHDHTVMAVIIEARIDIHHKNNAGHTALSYAKGMESPSLSYLSSLHEERIDEANHGAHRMPQYKEGTSAALATTVGRALYL